MSVAWEPGDGPLAFASGVWAEGFITKREMIAYCDKKNLDYNSFDWY